MLWAAGTVWAQFSGLSTTQDGSRVYFASSLPRRGTDQDSSSKIFMIDGAGPRFFGHSVQLAASASEVSGVPGLPTLSGPQVSGDGTVLTYIYSFPCAGGSSCLPQHVFTEVLTPTGTMESFPGVGLMSRSGRYLASSSITEIDAPWYFQLTDLSSDTTLYQTRTIINAAAIADDGTTILGDASSAYLFQDGQLRNLATSGPLTEAAIDAGAATAVLGIQTSSQVRTLFGLNLATGAQWQISPANTDSYHASLSANGAWVLYLSQAGSAVQIFFGPSNAARPAVQLSQIPSGVKEAILSGDGRYAFVTTGEGALLRIETASGTSQTRIEPTPSFTLQNCAAPGSLNFLTGTGLGAASVEIAGLSAPILSRSDTSIVFQVPWEAPISYTALVIAPGGAPFFADSQQVGIDSFCPQAIPLGPQDPKNLYTPLAMHSDWGSLVTVENPASAGEVVHFFLMGGGSVAGPMITGVPAPFSAAAPLHHAGIHHARWRSRPQRSVFWPRPGTPRRLSIGSPDSTTPGECRLH